MRVSFKLVIKESNRKAGWCFFSLGVYLKFIYIIAVIDKIKNNGFGCYLLGFLQNASYRPMYIIYITALSGLVIKLQNDIEFMCRDRKNNYEIYF